MRTIGRRGGISTTTSSLLRDLQFRMDKICGIVANRRKSSTEFTAPLIFDAR